jgi:starch phosphorylase
MKIKQGVFPHLPERLSGLEALSMNLWWSWHPAARMLFKTLDRQAWKESGHNPVKMLKEIPAEILASAAEDPGYLHQYDLVMEQLNRNIHSAENYFSRSIVSNGDPVVFFSAEYGLHHSLPFYAGGLGFLAGDFVKECCDMKVPIVAVGFMYPEGYFRQRIRDDGWQENMDQVLDRDAASISRVLRKEDGEHLAIKVPFIEPPIHVAVWKISIGCVSLYLMDTDIEINDPWNRQMSAHLYIGDIEQRLRQEIVLGIGGSEILDTLGIRHSLLHLNEGHCAFALLERIRDRVQGGMNYEDAVQEVRATTIFTTHTPVAAGHEIFPFSMIEKYFRSYWPSLGLDRDSFLQLGIHPGEPHAGFNMTALALKLSVYHNGVSRRHQEVARQMWQSLWPDLPPENIPIDHVTNGIHVPTWIEPKMELLFNRHLGPQWLEEHDNPAVWDRIDEIPDQELWQTHYWLKMKLINAVRERARRRWVENRTSTTAVLAMGTMLDPSILTIGFARRFATYKRADLILYNMERLKKLLKSRWRPIQIIFAGKAHPADDPGKRILQRVFNTARDPEMGGRIAFLEDYGEQFAQYLVHGVDVWLNNPLPPLEACGTSGMKAALNGVLHLSILDGWWVEGFNGKNGWTFGEGETGADRDGADAEALYNILEEKIIPLYYKVSSEGIPTEWVKMMKETIKSNASRFSTRRMVKEYIEKFYVPALKKAKLL